MKNSYEFWIKKWQKSKTFRVENDRIKPKSYLFSSFPKTNMYGFQNGNIRQILTGDFLARYQRMAGYNVLFPTGFDSLCLSAFLENKRHNNTIDDEISAIFEEQMLNLGVGIDDLKEIDLKHNDYLADLQLAFIELYEKGYIKYNYIEVYQDKRKQKIFDSYFKNSSLSPNRILAFYLDISEVKENITKSIEALPLSFDFKNELFKILEPSQSLTIPFLVTNGSKLNITLKEPQFMGGISFILIHPDYIDFSQYTLYEEYSAIEKYLADDNTNDFGVFTGTYAVNPLTGKKIPIFVSVKFDIDIYVANPYLNSNDRQMAIEEGLPYVDVVQNGVFIESDFLNGLSLDEGKKLLIDNFLAAEMATVNTYYSKDKILLSSLDTYGALIPFLKDNDNNIYSLKSFLPLTFSAKFRPILSEDIDVPGSLMSGSINHLFSTGMLPFLALLYDDIGASTSIFSPEALKAYAQWKGIETLTISPKELFELVFFPICIKAIIEKEKGANLPPLFQNIILVNDTFDDNYELMSRANNNLFDLSKQLKVYGGDAVRGYFLSKPLNQDFIFSEDELASFANLLMAIESYFNEDFVSSNNLGEKIKSLIKESNKLIGEKNIEGYIALLLNFYKTILWKERPTKKQALVFLKLLYPIIPFLVEDLYKEVFMGKYLISDDGWIL